MSFVQQRIGMFPGSSEKLCRLGCIVIAYGGEISARYCRSDDGQRNNLESHHVMKLSGQKAPSQRDAKKPIA